MSQPRISDLARGKIGLFTIDTLVNMVTAAWLNADVEIMVARRRRTNGLPDSRTGRAREGRASKCQHQRNRREQVKGRDGHAQVVVDQYQCIFQSLQERAGGVFDVLVTKPRPVWPAIGNSLKTPLPTAIKDVVATRVAAMLMEMFVPGAHVLLQQGGITGKGGGVFGGLDGIRANGAVPVYGSGGSVPGGLWNSPVSLGNGYFTRRHGETTRWQRCPEFLTIWSRPPRCSQAAPNQTFCDSYV